MVDLGNQENHQESCASMLAGRHLAKENLARESPTRKSLTKGRITCRMVHLQPHLIS